MAKLSTEELLDQFKEMTLIELSEFVKAFEETFEVTAAAPVAVAGAVGVQELVSLSLQGVPSTLEDRHHFCSPSPSSVPCSTALARPSVNLQSFFPSRDLSPHGPHGFWTHLGDLPWAGSKHS